MNSRKLDRDLVTAIAFVAGTILGLIVPGEGSRPSAAIMAGACFGVVTLMIVSIYNGIVK